MLYPRAIILRGDNDTPLPEDDFLSETDYEIQAFPAITAGHKIISNSGLN